MEGKRKKFWIDIPTQLQFVGFVCLLVVGSMLLAYLSMDHGLQEESMAAESLFMPVSAARHALLAPFLVSCAIAWVAAGVLGVFWSHRLIGPLMVLTAGLRRVREGNLKEDLQIRDFDLLSGTIQDFNEMQSSLRQVLSKEQENLKTIESRLGEISAKLRDQARPGRQEIEDIQSIRKELEKLMTFFRV